MAGLPWFTVCSDFPDHPKTVRLCRRLGEASAGMYVVRLWAFCTAYQQDGRITGEDAGAMVEHAAGWAGERGALLDALLYCGNAGGVGYLERIEGGFYVHEWVERNGAHLAKRDRDAERMRAKRAEKRQSREGRQGVARPSRDRRAGDRDREGEINNNCSLVSEAPASATRGPWERVVEVWERVCVPAGFAPARGTPAQKKKAAIRMREVGWFDAFRACCSYIVTDPFYRGGGSRGWTATLGWFLEPGKAEKTAERAATRRPSTPLDPIAGALREADEYVSGRGALPDDVLGGGEVGPSGSEPLEASADELAASTAALPAAIGAAVVRRRPARQLQDADDVGLGR